MGTIKNPKKDFPSVLDSAYDQYQRELALHKLVEEIMSKEVVTVNPESTMDEAAGIMGEKHIGSLIVTEYESPVGIVTERDLLSKVLAKDKDLQKATVESVMSYPLVTICSNAKIKEAARMMIKKKGRLAVFECGNLVGVITASDLIKSLPAIAETAIRVDDFMTKQVLTVDEQTSVSAVTKMMGEKRIGSVIVTSKGKPDSIFTERDLLTTFLCKAKPMETSVGSQSSSPLITAPSGTSIHKAAALMAIKHIRRLPITKEDKLAGIITARDLVEAYAK